jgi:hypothetical protein
MNMNELTPVMRAHATALKAIFPSVIYLSGRRDIDEQAFAMAKNVVVNRRFILRTYRQGHLLQMAVDQHPEATTVHELTTVLADALRAMPEEDLAKISDHFTGNAVDLFPLEARNEAGQYYPTAIGRAVIDWIRAQPETKVFMTRESGLLRWHWAVKSALSAEV